MRKKTKMPNKYTKAVRGALKPIMNDLDACYRASQPNVYAFAVKYCERKKIPPEIAQAIQSFSEDVQDNLLDEFLAPAFRKLESLIKGRLTKHQAFGEWVIEELEKTIGKALEGVDELFEKFEDGYSL